MFETTTSSRIRGKVIPLEALRGFAALLTVQHHFILAFLYSYHGVMTGTNTQRAFVGSPFFFLMNGKCAVCLFFVLSGYVLAMKGHGLHPTKSIISTMIKRWFRLAPLVVASVLFAYGVSLSGGYHYEEVAAINGSEWLTRSMDGQQVPQNSQTSFTKALTQGLYGAFLFGDATINTNLWTMQWEFYGSYLVLFIALFFQFTSWRAKCLLWFGLAASGAWLLMHHMWLFSFILGVFAASLNLRDRKIELLPVVILTVVALYICGYYYPQEAYSWARHIEFDADRLRVLIQSIGAFLLLVIFATENRVSKAFTGNFYRHLGSISFTLYLLHTILITSVSCWAYLAVGGGSLGILAAFIALFATLLPLSWLGGVLDAKWLDFLARWKL